MVKKRVAAKKPARKKKPSSKPKAGKRGDQSRLDLKPLQRHIRQRIKDLKEGRTGGGLAAAAAGESSEETIQRLESALETLEDICFPAMAIPI